MSDDDRKPGAVADLIEDLLAEDEIERRMAMPEEQRRAELKAMGLDPDRADAIANEVLAKAGFPAAPAKPPKVVDIAKEREKRRRPAWTLMLVAAAVAVAAIGGGAAIVANNTPAPTPSWPAPPVPTAPPGPSPEQLAQEQRAKADDLRKLAVADCAAGHWSPCKTELQGAYALDPDGSDTRVAKRLNREATRGISQDRLEGKTAPKPRSFGVEATALLVAKIAPLSGQSLRLECAAALEPSRLCDQLAAGIKKAGWTVTRVTLAPDAAVTHAMAIDVATDASDATQNAADALAEGLGDVNLLARGPHDMAPGEGAPLRLTVGVQ